jgi:hypothetical protein
MKSSYAGIRNCTFCDVDVDGRNGDTIKWVAVIRIEQNLGVIFFNRSILKAKTLKTFKTTEIL